ncbi:GNAT family protein [Citroniella saccharovorans]|uniref:GNAT family protein n=1 Tax=Citroniella saccharovorans TaxID=2053367 RepID=A0AAW9MQ50_9FIRM|nr:GNAT family protein [Citroniella saccharovorans]MEB3429201.1 GNAT family protein [Citroniella saccharovorans]
MDKRVEIRQITEKDADNLYNLIEKNKAFLSTWMDFFEKVDKNSVVYSIEKWKKSMILGESFEFGIFLNNDIIGMVSLIIEKDGNLADLGYWLGEEYTKNGYATEAVSYVLEFAFTFLSLNKVQIKVHEDNFKSQNIPKRLGFRYDAILREHQRLHGRYVNLFLFSMLKREWNELWKKTN